MKPKTKPIPSEAARIAELRSRKVSPPRTLAPTTPPLVAQSVAAGLVRSVEGMLDKPEPSPLEEPFKDAPKIVLATRHRAELKKLRDRQRSERWRLGKQEKLAFTTSYGLAQREKAEAKKRLGTALQKLRSAYGDFAVYLVRGERMKIWPDGEGGFYFRRVGTSANAGVPEGPAEHAVKQRRGKVG